MSSSFAPREARPISCENCANSGSANMGVWPRSSWITSLRREKQCQEREALGEPHLTTSKYDDIVPCQFYHLRFWRVVGTRGMSHVLRALEHAERKAGQEISCCYQPRCRSKCKSRCFCWGKTSQCGIILILKRHIILTFEKLRYILHLRHDVFIEAALFDHPFEDTTMCCTRATR